MAETKVIQIEIPANKKAEWQEVNGKLTLVCVDVEDNRPVTERIKTFEDAMEATGMTIPLSENQLSYLPKDVVAYMKLRIIAAALNELHETTLEDFPKFTTDEYRYYPWFYLYTQEEIDEMDEEKKKSLLLWGGRAYAGASCGFVYSYSSSAFGHSTSNLAARLAVKTEELAVYFGKQFRDIWAEYVFKPQVTE